MRRAKKTCLLIADVPGWAFDINNQDIEEYCSKYFDFASFYMVDLNLIPLHWDADFIFCPWHRSLYHFRNRTLLGALRSQWFNPSKPGPPTDYDKEAIRRCAGFQVCTRDMYDALKDDCNNVVYLTNPVNMRRFPSATPRRDEIVCGWNGNAMHNSSSVDADAKGVFSYIMPACAIADVRLVYAEYNTCRLRPDQMHSFYMRANVALCASKFEGASNSVMEAMACGQAVIVTDVGNHREMQEKQIAQYGDTGIIIVKRDMMAFVEAIRSLSPLRAHEMGSINRISIAEQWSWSVWAEPYIDFLSMAVEGGEDI